MAPADFSKEEESENSGDFLRHMRRDDTDGGTGSDERHDEGTGSVELEARDDETTGYLPEMRGCHLSCDIGNPGRKGLSYIVYSTSSEQMAERLLLLLSRFVFPCAIVEEHGDNFYTFGCWLKESEIEVVEASLPMHETEHVDWDEQMRQLLLEEEDDQ